MKLNFPKTFLIYFFVFQSLVGNAAGTEQQDRVEKTVIKAAIVQYASRTGEWHGKGWGYFVTDWFITKMYAPKSGSVIRKAVGWSDNANSAEQWVPVGRVVGGYVGSFLASVTAFFLVDRYYSPWKRLVTSSLDGDFSFSNRKPGDLRKIIESCILGPCVGYAIYFDLKVKAPRYGSDTLGLI